MKGDQYSVICIVVIVALGSSFSVIGFIGITAEIAQAQPQLEIEATTPHGDPVNAVSKAGQPINVHISYSGLGDGTHSIEVRDSNAIFDETIREIEVEGDSGEETIQIEGDELLETRGAVPDVFLGLYAAHGDVESERLALPWMSTTVYSMDYESTVEANEETTITYYGWTSEDEAEVFLFRNNPPADDNFNDEQIRMTEVTPDENNYFEGTFTFEPGLFVDESEDTLPLQVRRTDGIRIADNWPDETTEIEVIHDVEPVVDASIREFTVLDETVEDGETVEADVVVQNTGEDEHTYFVGFSVYGADGEERHNQGTTGTTVTLGPGDEETVTVTWEVEDDAPTGSYEAETAVWEESDRSGLETRLDDVLRDGAFEVVEVSPTGDVDDTEEDVDDTEEDDSSGDDEMFTQIDDEDDETADDHIDDEQYVDEVEESDGLYDDAETDEDTLDDSGTDDIGGGGETTDNGTGNYLLYGVIASLMGIAAAAAITAAYWYGRAKTGT